MKIVFATANPGKRREAAEILGEAFELVTPEALGITGEIPETGATLRENSRQKADYLYARTGLNCFADDSGLEVDLLDGAPGVETARYAGPGHDAQANMDKLLSEMERRGGSPRSARFRTSVTLILNGEYHYFDGVMEGRIATERHGSGGFGYDPVFIPAGFDKTSAELGEDVKNRISHRSQALRAMAEFLHGKH